MFWARPVVMLVNEMFGKSSVFGETTLIRISLIRGLVRERESAGPFGGELSSIFR